MNCQFQLMSLLYNSQSTRLMISFCKCKHTWNGGKAHGKPYPQLLPTLARHCLGQQQRQTLPCWLSAADQHLCNRATTASHCSSHTQRLSCNADDKCCTKPSVCDDLCCHSTAPTTAAAWSVAIRSKCMSCRLCSSRALSTRQLTVCT